MIMFRKRATKISENNFRIVTRNLTTNGRKFADSQLIA